MAGWQEIETWIGTTCRVRFNIYLDGYGGEREKGEAERERERDRETCARQERTVRRRFKMAGRGQRSPGRAGRGSATTCWGSWLLCDLVAALRAAL